MAAQLRKIGSFEPTELTSETFRDTLSQTVDMLARAIQAQSQHIKELRAKVDELERRQTTEKRTGDKEWEAFQWLFDRVPDIVDEDEAGGIKAAKKRKRKSAAIKSEGALGDAVGLANTSQDLEEDEDGGEGGEDTEGLEDDASEALNSKRPKPQQVPTASSSKPNGQAATALHTVPFVGVGGVGGVPMPPAH